MKQTTLRKTRIALILLFALMLTAGAVLKEPRTVYKKAIDLCLECIGLGG